MVRNVLDNYRELKQEEGRRPLLPALMWNSVVLCIVCVVLTFFFLSHGK